MNGETLLAQGHWPSGTVVLVSFGLFIIGLIGLLSQRQVIRQLFGIKIMLQGVSLGLINAGVANDKTGDLLKRLDRDVLSHEPATVLLFIGGNDYLDGTPRGLFRERLDAVAGRIASAGCRLVIVEVPSGIIWNRYAGVYRHVARRHGASLVPESRLRLWYSVELLARDRLPEPLTLDGIHLSPAGARRVADWLEPHVRVRPGAACITPRGKLAEL